MTNSSQKRMFPYEKATNTNPKKHVRFHSEITNSNQATSTRLCKMLVTTKHGIPGKKLTASVDSVEIYASVDSVEF